MKNALLISRTLAEETHTSVFDVNLFHSLTGQTEFEIRSDCESHQKQYYTVEFCNIPKQRFD